MIDSLKLLPRYFKAFGPFAGLPVFVSAELFGNKVSVPGIRRPIKLRRGTSDLAVFREVFLFRTYDIDLMEPKVIIDAGANIGLASIYFANRYKHARIYAVEPDTSNFEQLLENAGHYDNIVPVHAAFWKRDTKLRLIDGGAAAWAFSVEECGSNERTGIDGLSVDSFMERHKIQTVDVLKLDIEGSEKEVFEADGGWMDKTRCMVVEVHDWMKPGSSKAVLKAVSAHNFALRVVNSLLVFTNLNIR